MRSDARRRADRQGHARSHICEKSLMLLARTAPSPASPFTGSGTSRQARSRFYLGSYPPQPQTISNSKDVTQIREVFFRLSTALEPRPGGRGPSRYPVARNEGVLAICEVRPSLCERREAVLRWATKVIHGEAANN